MANSFVEYPISGATYAVPFPYLSKSHVFVYRDGTLLTEGADYTWGSPSSITLVSATGAILEIRRKTSWASRLVDYAGGTVLTEADLDTDSLQGFYMSQEAVDIEERTVVAAGVPTGGSAGQILAKIDGADYNTQWITNSVSGVSDGDKGDIVVSGSGGTFTIDSSVLSAFGRTLVDDVDAVAARTTLGLGTAATSASSAFAAASHTHIIADVTGLQTALDNKVDDSQISAFGLTLVDDVDATTARTTLGLGSLATLSSVDLTTNVTGDLPFSNIAQIATASFLGRNTAGTGDIETLSVSTAKTLLNLTGTNSGDQTITLTGDVTGSGTGSFAATIANNSVTLAKMADIATSSFLGRVTASTGDPEVLTVAQAKTLLNLTGTNSGDQTITLTGDVTGSGTASFAATIANNSVTLAKMADIATSSFLGRVTAATGDPEVLTVAQAKTLLNLTGTNSGDQTITLTGDVTGSGTASFAATVANDAITNAKLANVNSGTFKGRVTAAAGDPEDLTGTQATTLLDVFTTSLKGLAPASGGGTTNYLRADGTWASPPGGSATQAFGTIAVSGQSDVVADAAPDTLTLVAGSNITITTNATTDTITIAASGGGVTDGDKGDITVSASGATWTIDNSAVTLAKIANIATATFLGRNTAGSGVTEELSVATAKTMLGLTGTNSGDQTITLTGDVTGSGTSSFAATIANNSVTLAKMADIATSSFLGRVTAATGDPEVLTVAQAKTLLNLTGTNSGDQTITLTGDVTGTGTASFAATIANSAVTNAKLANMAANSIKGNNTGVSAAAADLTAAQVKTLLAITSSDVSGLGSLATLSAVGAAQITDNSVTNAELAQVATATFKGRTTAGTGNVEDLTVAQAKTLLNLTGTNSGDQTITLTGDVTGTGTASFAATIGNNTVTYAKMQDVTATNRFLGRITAGAGDPEELTGTQATTLLDTFTTALKGLAPASGGGTTNYLRADGTWAAPPGTGGVTDGDKGDITVSSGGTVWTIDANAVTNADLAQVATATLKGRVTAGTGNVEDLTGTQATTLLDTFTSGLKGLAPASGGGTTNFLRADGTWAAPPGGGGNTFSTIAVSGQSDVVADASADTLTLAAGSGITITTNASTDTVTIAASGGSAWETGDVKDTFVTSAPTGWIFADGRTIGNAASGATNRANADTEALYTLFWNNLDNTLAPVSGGRGASAAADYAANKTITVPDMRGRTRVGKDNMGGTTASRLTSAGSGIDGTILGNSGGTETHTLTQAQLASHTHTFNTSVLYRPSGGSGSGGSNLSGTLGAPSTALANNSTGSGTAHQNTQPSIVVNVLIKL